MHEDEGLFCKTGSLWINGKIHSAWKKIHGPNLVGPIGRKNRGALGCGLTHGLQPVSGGGGRLKGEAEAWLQLGLALAHRGEAGRGQCRGGTLIRL